MVIFVITGLLAMAGIGAAYYVRKRKKKETEADEMPAGLQIFDSKGNCVFDTTDYTFRTIGTGVTGTEDGALHDSRITEKTVVIPYSIDAPLTRVSVYDDMYTLTPNFNASDGSIAWTFPTTSTEYYTFLFKRQSVNFVYGEWR